MTVRRGRACRPLAATALLLGLSPLVPSAGRPAAAAPVVAFAAFGDSISAGEGLPDIEPGEEGCQRALGRPIPGKNERRSTAWAVQVRERFAVGGPSWMAACTGAKTKNFAIEKQAKNGRDKVQMEEATTGAQVDRFHVTTSTFGINDAASYDAAHQSMTQLVLDCIGIDEAALGGASGARAGATGGWLGGGGGVLGGAAAGLTRGRCRAGLGDTLRRHVEGTVRADLRRMYDKMHEVSSHRGLIVAAGYPEMFEESKDWHWINRRIGRCQMFARADADMLRGALDHLNRVVKEEMDAARRRHPDRTWAFVSVKAAFADHLLCTEDGGQWINGLTIGGLRPHRSYHPTQAGHDAYARAVVAHRAVDDWFDHVESNVAEAEAQARSAAPGGPAVAVSTTSLVIDVSSSMTEQAATMPVRKIDAAIQAAQDIIGVVETDGGGHGVGVVKFSGTAEVVAPVTTDLASLRPLVAGLVTQADTNVGAGLELGMQQLASAPGRKTLVLLSDGVATTGPSSAEILARFVARARDEGIQVFTIGFGAGAEIDEDLLRSLSAGTGGEYSLVSTPLALRMALIEARYSSLGTVVRTAQGQVAQGQVVDAATFAVPPQKQELHVAVASSASDLDAVLVDPTGRVVDEGYRGARLFRDQNPDVAIVTRPAKGDWNLRVTGKEVGPGTADFVALASTRGQAALVDQSSGSALLPLLVGGGGMLLAGGGAGYAAVRRRRRGAGPAADATAAGTLFVRVLSGPQSGALLAVRSGDVVGRGEDVDHVVGDETVSRRHARFAWMEGAWAVLDLESTSGTYRNGEPVLRAHLAVGDVLTLGSVDLGVEGARRG